MGKIVLKVLKDGFKKMYKQRLDNNIHVSNLISFCPREYALIQQFGKEYNTGKTLSIADIVNFEIGNGIHASVTVAFSKDAQTVFSGALDNTIKVWSIENNQLITTLAQHQDWILALATSQPENLLVSAGKDKTVKLWQY